MTVWNDKEIRKAVKPLQSPKIFAWNKVYHEVDNKTVENDSEIADAFE